MQVSLIVLMNFQKDAKDGKKKKKNPTKIGRLGE